MNSRDADALAASLAQKLAAGKVVDAYAAIEPILEQRTPFRLLDRIANTAGPSHWLQTSVFLDQIAAGGTEGGWVIIGSTLRQHYQTRPATVFAECRRYIVAADRWYGADILGERLPGPALVEDFERARALLAPWRSATNRWLRRAVGVAVHYWAKGSQGDQVLAGQAHSLLSLLQPLFDEREMDAVKGVGWGLKTVGKYYPLQLTNWLMDQSGRPYRRLMLNKALTYLPDDQCEQVMGAYDL